MNLLELTNDQMLNTTVKDRLKQKKATQQASEPVQPAQEPAQEPAPAAPTAPAGAIVNMPSGDHFVKTTDGTWAQSDEKGNLTGRPAEGPNSAMARDLEKYAAQTGVASSVDAPADPVVQKITPDAPAPADAPATAPATQDIPVGTKAIFVKSDKYRTDPKMRKDVVVIGPSKDGKETYVNVRDEKNKTFNVGKDRLLDPKTMTPILKPQAAQTKAATPTATGTTGQTQQQPTATPGSQATGGVQQAPTAGGSTGGTQQAPTAGGPNTAKPVGGIAQNPQSTQGMSRSTPPSAEIDPKAGTINAPEPEGILGKAKRVGQGVVDKITTATGGSLATKTMQDPNANTGKKIGAKFGAGLGRAMSGGIKGLQKMRKDAQPQGQPQGQAQGQAQPTGMAPQVHRDLGGYQANVLNAKDPQKQIQSAKAMVDTLSSQMKKGIDPAELSPYANAVAPILKRNPEFMKNNQQLYTHLVKLARGLRTEAYTHMCNILEHVGLTWEDLGYKVSIIESNVILFPTKELTQLEESVSQQEMKVLAGI